MEKGKFHGLARTLEDGRTVFVGKGHDMDGTESYAISVSRPMEAEPSMPTCECKWEGGTMTTSVLFTPKALDAIADIRRRLDHADDLNILQGLADGSIEVERRVMENPESRGDQKP